MIPPTHLIVVCCHAIWTGGPSKGFDEAEWLIADFQRGETGTLIEHVRQGVRALASDPEAVLALSGGPTRASTRLSEAQSYLNVAAAHDFWGLIQGPDASPSTTTTTTTAPPPPSARILIEDRALDSYHNILFSLTLFHATHHTWPARLTIISHAFKQTRLIDQHCAVIGFPLNRVSFIGIDPPGMAAGGSLNSGNSNDGNHGGSGDDAWLGVGQAVDDWARDPHGRDAKLAGKRAARNPWGVWQGVFPEGVEDVEGRGGLVTVGVGEEETLVDDVARPWML